MLETGEIAAFSLPDCQLLPVAQTLPPALSFVSPPIIQFSIALIPHQKWASFIGRQESRMNRNILLGGAPARRRLRRFEIRNVILSAHADGVVRLWDASHGEVESNEAFEIDVAGVLHSFTPGSPVDVISLSMAGMTGEVGVGTYAGEVAIWRHGIRNRDDELAGEMGNMNLEKRPNQILHLTKHLHFNVNEGFLPLCMVNPQKGAPIVLKMSEVGFVAIGYDSGYVCVVDLRGPVVIFLEDLSNVVSEKDKRDRKKAHQTRVVEVPSAMEFAIMKLEGVEYSSLVLITGTSQGRLISHALVPAKTGGYAVCFDNSTSFATEGAIVAILPIRTRDGASIVATPGALAGLREGQITEGATVVVQERGIRILGGVTNKLEKLEMKDRSLVMGQIVQREKGIAIAVVSNNRRITSFSVPDIQRIGEITLPNSVVVERYSRLPSSLF
jgi:hypothetical protein